MTRTLSALAAALLSGLGVGSGGLYLLYLSRVMGVAQYTAQAENLVFFALSTLASSVMNFRAGRLPGGRLLPLLLSGVPGAALGALLTSYVPPGAARSGFGAIMAVAGLYTLLRAFLHGRRGKEEKMHRSAHKIP